MIERASLIQLTEYVAEKSGCSKAEAKRRIETVLEGIVHLADEYPKLVLREFGKFENKVYKGYTHNATIGEAKEIPTRRVLTFTSSPKLTQEVEDD
jgi:nucleoid DNA-binding protein